MTTCTIVSTSTAKLKITLHSSSETIDIDQLSFKLVDGWQKLSLTVLDDGEFKIDDLLLDNQSVAELYYTSWGVDETGKILQPVNKFNKNINWYMILHNDHGLLKERVIERNYENDLGTNLFDKYKIFFDMGTTLKLPFTPRLTQYFSRQQGLNYFPHTKINDFPFVPLELIPWDDEVIFNEIKDLTYNANGVMANEWYWTTVFDKINNKNMIQKNLKDWLHANNLKDINNINISMVKSNGGFIEVHRDYKMRYPRQNNHFIHIPIYNNPDRLVKVSNAGLMPHGANILNNCDYAHAVVNQSDSDGYAIIINAHMSDDFITERMRNVNIGL